MDGEANGGRRLYPSRIDIDEAVRAEETDLLNATLATVSDLKTQVKQAHWNVKGTDFYQLHEMFDEIAGELEEHADLAAEQITALGGYAYGTVRAAAGGTILPEFPFGAVDGPEHVEALAERFALYCKHLRDGLAETERLGDTDTNDLYTEVSRVADKRLWFLEAHLQGSAASVGENPSVDASAAGSGGAG